MVCTVKVSFSSPCLVQSTGHVQSTTSLPALDSSGCLCSLSHTVTRNTFVSTTPWNRSSLCLLGLQFPIFPQQFKMLSLAPVVSNGRLTRSPVFALCVLYFCMLSNVPVWGICVSVHRPEVDTEYLPELLHLRCFKEKSLNDHGIYQFG